METEPCNVCSGTDLKLIDGFYYCVECGTQNTNVRETIVEKKTLGDGTFGVGTKRKILQLEDSTIQMSGEWYKWHAFNFILSSLADDLITLGAKPTFKMKLLWIWTRYVKKYQNKEELRSTEKPDGDNTDAHLTTFFVEEGDSNTVSENDDENMSKTNKNMITKDISVITRGVVVAMLYLALNLDQSDIQLSHLHRFIKEKRLNVDSVKKLVPKEIPLLKIPRWKSFLNSRLPTTHELRTITISLLNQLDLGSPIVPNLKTIVDNFLLELCLPKELKPLICSLMYLRPCYFLDMDNKAKQIARRLPDYEVTVMSYILVALKLCFGLDGNYEVKLSEVIDKINEERDLSKSHKIGKYSEPSNRLFSFREWCNYLQYRKIMLSKHSPLMMNQHYMDINDYSYFEHYEHTDTDKKDKRKTNTDLMDKISIDIISKIPYENDANVIAKSLFNPSLTPLSEYTDLIIEQSQDLDKRLLLSEDFTQYSLKYACEYLDLKDLTTGENLIVGVSEEGKTISNVISGSIVTKKSKPKMVYVKNCENINWRKTNPPTMEHIVCDATTTDADNLSQSVTNDRESDHGYDSDPIPNESKDITDINGSLNDPSLIDTDVTDRTNLDEQVSTIQNDECSPERSDDQNPQEETTKEVLIEEEDFNNNIFDDLFEDFDLKDEPQEEPLEDIGFHNEEPILPNNDIPNEHVDNLSDWSNEDFVQFNPATFDRQRTIKECILAACKKHKIPIPSEYRIREPRRRRTEGIITDDGEPKPKRTRLKPREAKKKVEELISTYYNNLQFDFMHRMQTEVNLAIQNPRVQEILNESAPINIEENLPLSDANSIVSGREDLELGQGEEPYQSISNNHDITNVQTLETTNRTDLMYKDDNENLEDTLFDEDDEMKLDDLLPKNDPKFDTEKYNTDQLYIKIKKDPDDQENLDLLAIEDPNLEAILVKKIEECEHNNKYNKFKAQTKVYEKEMDDVFDSEDEDTLFAIKEEKRLIEEMENYEESFGSLITKEQLQEYKYWFRHYDSCWLAKATDLHKTFDEELRQNTPTSFYFIIQECAGILNCSTFYLYKNMQRLEQYLMAKVKNCPVGEQSLFNDKNEECSSNEKVT